MRVLLVGGLGSIGYNLCRQLIEEEIDVLALDDIISNDHDNKEEKLLQIGRNAFFQFSSLDTDYRVEKEKFEVIIYCLNDPIDRQGNPNMMNDIELEKHLKNALGYCRDYESKFILISSSTESSNQFAETENEKKPSYEKNDGLIQEQLVIDSFESEGGHFRIVRLSFDDIERNNDSEIGSLYLSRTKDKSIFNMTTSAKDSGGGSVIFTEWLQNNWNKED